MPIPEIKIVTSETCFQVITDYINSNEILISDYNDIIEVVLKMMREGVCFNFDKNLLRGFLEDIVYMCAPNDDANKSRIVNMLEESDDDEDSDDDDDENPNQMEAMMRMLMGGGASQKQASEEGESAEVEPEPELERSTSD